MDGSTISMELEKVSIKEFFHPFSRRMYVVLTLMIYMSVSVYIRGSLGITMTCMVNNTGAAMQHSLGVHKTKPIPDDYTKKCVHIRDGLSNRSSMDTNAFLNDYGGNIIWSTHEQNLVLSAMMLGSMISMFPAGYLADRYSPVMILKLTALGYALFNTLMPMLAEHTSFGAVYAARFALGLVDGFAAPSVFALISRWVPNSEKSQAVSLFTIGGQLAGVAYPPISVGFCASVFTWHANFYFPCECSNGMTISIFLAILILLWLLAFCFIGVDSPHEAINISASEKKYLTENIHFHCTKTHGKRPKFPWRGLLSSPVLAAAYCNFAFGIYICMILLFIPAFFKEVLFLNMKQNGFYSAIPPCAQIVSKIGWSVTIDRLKRNGTISHSTGCRISHITGSVFVSIFMLLIGYLAHCGTPTVTLYLLIINSIFSGTFASGAITALMSLAPLHTGILTSLSTAVLIGGQFIFPMIVSGVRVHGTIDEWRLILYIISAIMASGGVVFALFGSADPQEWAHPPLPDLAPEQTKLPLDDLDENEDGCVPYAVSGLRFIDETARKQDEENYTE